MSTSNTNGHDQSQPQTRTPDTPIYKSVEDVYRRYAPAMPDYEPQIKDAGRMSRVAGIADVVTSIANIISAAHGGVPIQSTSLSAANNKRLQQLNALQQQGRQQRAQGLLSARLEDVRNARQDYLRKQQQDREDAIRQEQYQREDDKATQAQRNWRASHDQAQQQIDDLKAYREGQLASGRIAAGNKAALAQSRAQIAYYRDSIEVSTPTGPYRVSKDFYNTAQDRFGEFAEIVQQHANDPKCKQLAQDFALATYGNACAKGAAVREFLASGLPEAEGVLKEAAEDYAGRHQQAFDYGGRRQQVFNYDEGAETFDYSDK